MNRFLVVFSGILFSTLFGLFFADSSASAVSYDSPRIVDELFMGPSICANSTKTGDNLFVGLNEVYPEAHFVELMDWSINEWIIYNFYDGNSGKWWALLAIIPKDIIVGPASYGYSNFGDAYAKNGFYIPIKPSASHYDILYFGISMDDNCQNYERKGSSFPLETSSSFKDSTMPSGVRAIYLGYLMEDLWASNYMYKTSIYLYTGEYVNPDGGATEIVRPPATDEPEAEKEIRQPQFSYSVNGKTVSATPYAPEPDLPDFTSQLDEGYTFNGYFIQWSLFKCSEGFDDVGQVCEGDASINQVDYQLLGVDQPYSFSVDEYSWYQLNAVYHVQQCYRYPSYPTTPDHCFYSDLRSYWGSESFQYINAWVALNADGSVIIGDTKDMTCNVGGFCQPQEDRCFEAGNWFQSISCRFDKATKIGLINPALESFQRLVKSIIVPANPTCSIPLPDVHYLGRTIPVNQLGIKTCDASAQVHRTLPIISILANFVFGFGLLVMIAALVNRILDERKHKIIEGV